MATLNLTLNVAADATLIEDPQGALANGTGPTLFFGRVNSIGGQTLRRALLRFALPNLPAGTSVTSAALQMDLTRSRLAGTLPSTVHRLTADWNEGPTFDSNGDGAPSTTGDVTWIHRRYPDLAWGTAGGDHVAAASATTQVGTISGTYVWGPSAALAADVQQWLDAPATNFGWIVLGAEDTVPSAKAVAARESGASGPRLLLTLLTPETSNDAPLPAWALATLGAGLGLAAWRKRRLRAR